MSIICGLATMAYNQIFLLVTYMALSFYQILRHHYTYSVQRIEQVDSVDSRNNRDSKRDESSGVKLSANSQQTSTYIELNNAFDDYSFNICMLLGFLFMCIFSRAYSQRERRRFKEEKQQSLILQMFAGLVKNHHDGILVTVENRVILHNTRINQIFPDNTEGPPDLVEIPSTHFEKEPGGIEAQGGDKLSQTSIIKNVSNCVKEDENPIIKSLKSA